MRRSFYIPKAVLDDIAERVRQGVDETLAEYESAAEDEDTLTGHLGAKLTTRARRVVVRADEIPGTWTWSLSYTKFRGRGPGATEKRLGADGIFELALAAEGRPAELKSLLFQSKMEGSGGADLVEQCARLSTWREAAVVLAYSPERISAYSIDSVLAARGLPKRAQSTQLDTYLAHSFVACLVGDNDLRYIPSRRTLVWRTMAGERVSANFEIKQRLRFTVRPPRRAPWLVARNVGTDEVHKHRMEATDEEILSVKPGRDVANPKQAVRALSKIYHPDLFEKFPLETRELMTARMQEINSASERIRRS